MPVQSHLPALVSLPEPVLPLGWESTSLAPRKQVSGPSFILLCVAQVVVVQAISALCQKYPRKHAVLMNFLFTMLREEVRPGLAGTCLVS